ncbi:hypothetical protein OAT16_10355 [Prolixibacteraceae bacterium]|nr:hypothetical protein [Prolixibacteraceae bacterium]
MIKLKFNQVFILAFLLQICFISTGFTQEQGAKEEAIAYFKKENYQDAYPLFVQLHELYSSDPLMNYYYGVTKVKIGRFDQDIITSLRNALISNQTPADALFYLGQTYHAFEQFEKAIDAYARFEEKSKKKEQKQLDVKKLKELAYEKKNPFSIAVGRSRVERIKEEKEQQHLDQVSNEIKDESGVTDIKDEETTSKSIQLDSYNINFNINSTLTYHRVNDFKESSARQLYLKGLELKMKRIGLSETIDSLRQEFNDIERDQNNYSKSEAAAKRQSLTDQIIELEHQLYPLLKKEQQRFAQSKVVEQTYWKDFSLNQQKTYANKLLQKYKPEAILFETVKEDTLKTQPTNTIEAPKKEMKPSSSNSEQKKQENKTEIKSHSTMKEVATQSKIVTATKSAAIQSAAIQSAATKSAAIESAATEIAATESAATKSAATKSAAIESAATEIAATNNKKKQTKVESVDVPSVNFDEDMTFEVATKNTPISTVKNSSSNKTVKESNKTNHKLAKAYYAIQIIASKGDVSNDVKNKVTTAVSAPLHYYTKGTTRYYIVGHFDNLKEAATAKSSLRSGGFSDAFTVALNDKGERISFVDAKKLIQ